MSDVRVLLDTNIVSYLMKGSPEYRAYMPHLKGKLLAIAFITVGELYFGAEWKKWGPKKRTALETTLRNFVVMPYDHELARCYGRLMAERKLSGRTVAPNDAWIAACAVRHDVPLVTPDAHFRDIPNLHVITEAVQDD